MNDETLRWIRGEPPRKRIRIQPGEKAPIDLSARERELILEHTFADDDLTARLRVLPPPGRRPRYWFTLEDLDELAGSVAAEANHATNRKLGRELLNLHARISDMLDRYTDEEDAAP